MEKQRWSEEQWDERLRLRMLELEERLPESDPDPAAWQAMDLKLNAAQQSASPKEEKQRRALLWWWGAKAAPGAAAPGATSPVATAAGNNASLRWAAAVTGLLLLAGLGWGVYLQGNRAWDDKAATAETAVSSEKDHNERRPGQSGQAGGAAITHSKERAGALPENASEPSGAQQAAGAAAENSGPLAQKGQAPQAKQTGDATSREQAGDKRTGSPGAGRGMATAPPAAVSQVGESTARQTLLAHRQDDMLPRLEKIPAETGGLQLLTDPESTAPEGLALWLDTIQDKPSVPAPKREKKPLSPQRWSLAVSALPDMSGTGGLAGSRFGGGGGLLLGYQLGRQLRLQGGAMYVIKNYAGNGSFMPNGGGYGGGYGGSSPLSLDASCRVLDLPLGLQYEFARAKGVRFFASAGISSYLMLSERYQFNYSYTSTTYTYNNENRHWFSILNGGIGLETPLGNHLKLQAQPYYKLPLKGVGAGEIRLNSFGLQLQLRYDL